mmetsp:Transcript_11231/g.38322  ORF Transcript_11231/g.38322 Transcript_11231/m.38322 type:complete len:104 (-) Transcript_11231:182-493(-)
MPVARNPNMVLDENANSVHDTSAMLSCYTIQTVSKNWKSSKRFKYQQSLVTNNSVCSQINIHQKFLNKLCNNDSTTVKSIFLVEIKTQPTLLALPAHEQYHIL